MANICLHIFGTGLNPSPRFFVMYGEQDVIEIVKDNGARYPLFYCHFYMEVLLTLLTCCKADSTYC